MVAAQEIIQWRAFGPSDARVSGLLRENAAISQAVAELYAALWAGGRVAEPLSYVGGPAAISSLAVAPEGRQVAAAQDDGIICPAGCRNGASLRPIRCPWDGTRWVMLRDGRLYAAAARDGELVYYQPGNADEVSSRWAEASALFDLLIDPDAARIAASDRNGRVWFWQSQDGEKSQRA